MIKEIQLHPECSADSVMEEVCSVLRVEKSNCKGRSDAAKLWIGVSF